jgi:DTW domain-containing protein YfiP
VVVVRHRREGWKSTGTARIAALALPGLTCLEYGEDTQPAQDALDARVLAGAAVLFPAEATTGLDLAAITRLVVLDGTWRQTRRMYKRLPALHALPCLALPQKAAPVLRLRSTTFEAGRSTLEAIADALQLLEGPAVAAPLHALHDLYVERTLRARGAWEQRTRGDPLGPC